MTTLTNVHLRYKELISKPAKQNPIVIGVGCAGTGKTQIACQVGIDKLIKREVGKLIITRPAITVDENHGFLPGKIDQKMLPYMKPMYDGMLEYVSYNTLKSFLNDEKIEICPFSYMRGRTFHNAFIIADEVQNTTKIQMQTLLTRIGKNTKIVLTGDLSQCDLNLKSKNGMQDILDRCENLFNASDEICIDIIKFSDKDILRSDVCKKLISLYNTD